jgi:PEGA domain
MRLNRSGLLLAVSLLTLIAFAKDQPVQSVVWPGTGTPILQFSFSKFKQLGSVGTERTYQTDTTAQNLSAKLIPNVNLFLYLFDKNKVRIGEGWITLTNVGPGETVKFQTTVSASGVPVSVSLENRAATTVGVTVNSVPQGALVKLDGTEVGTTPKVVQVGVGKHMLEFAKEGFNTGHFPLEVGSNDVSGGSVSYELGASAHDTVELRDGSVLNGDLESVSATEIVVRIGGAMQHLNRNQVKRILLVERDAPAQ